ncbi:unnamed protein product [Gadus morhua 'NCC']
MLNVTTETEPTDVGTLHVSVGLDEKINHTLRSFWEIESIGIMNDKESQKSNEEALQLFEKTVQFKEERYEVRLPWENDDAVKENVAVVEITSLLNSKGSKEMEILEIKNHSDLSRMLRIRLLPGSDDS